MELDVLWGHVFDMLGARAMSKGVMDVVAFVQSRGVDWGVLLAYLMHAVPCVDDRGSSFEM